ncbi:MAG: efflux RND transporter periplasmic adaptor subunit [Bacteroidaceae bacterium]|nr:efflux RND transporter periplasmic adaptor subunit [Bacteroidaceae bacterium]
MYMRKNILKSAALPLMACALFLCCGVGCSKKPKIEYETTTVEKGNISTTVTATGTIEPVTSVEVGTQVSGIVSKIYVDYNSEVKAGQVIAELDKTNLTSTLASQRANLTSVQSALAYQKANYERQKSLYDKGLISANDFEQARLSYVQAQQQVTTARQSVKRAETDLGYATITSPINGVVLSKAVEEGQTVAASFSTPTLFTIAQDLTDMRVIADIDEADIGEVKEGQRVSFAVDAFPNDTFEGRVTQVRQQATTESNVVTYEVVISAPNADLKLKPGLTANVTIFTLEKNDVLTVAAKALRFSPNEALIAEDETIEPCEAQHKLWVREGKTFKAYPVEVGVSNGTMTEVAGGIKAGTEVLADMVFEAVADDADSQQKSNPFMPGPRNRNNNQNKNGNQKK